MITSHDYVIEVICTTGSSKGCTVNHKTWHCNLNNIPLKSFLYVISKVSFKKGKKKFCFVQLSQSHPICIISKALALSFNTPKQTYLTWAAELTVLTGSSEDSYSRVGGWVAGTRWWWDAARLHSVQLFRFPTLGGGVSAPHSAPRSGDGLPGVAGVPFQCYALQGCGEGEGRMICWDHVMEEGLQGAWLVFFHFPPSRMLGWSCPILYYQDIWIAGAMCGGGSPAWLSLSLPLRAALAAPMHFQRNVHFYCFDGSLSGTL